MTEYLTNTFKNDDLDEDFEAVSNQSLHDLLETITSVPNDRVFVSYKSSSIRQIVVMANI